MQVLSYDDLSVPVDYSRPAIYILEETTNYPCLVLYDQGGDVSRPDYTSQWFFVLTPLNWECN